MKKIIELPENVIEILQKDANYYKRSIKAHLEYLLIMESNKITTVNYIGGNLNLDES